MKTRFALLAAILLSLSAVNSFAATALPDVPADVANMINYLFTTGTAALVSGTATVACPIITGSSKVLVTSATSSLTVPIAVSSIVSGTSFSVVSGTANGNFNYLILNQ